MGKEVADTLFRQIDEAIVYSLKSVQNVIINDRRCFELYGYEFILFIVRAIRLTSCFFQVRLAHRRAAQALAHRGQRVALADVHHGG